MRHSGVLVLAAALWFCGAAWAEDNGQEAPAAASAPVAAPTDEAKINQLLTDGARLAKAGRQREAIANFDQVLALYEQAYPNNGTRYYAARSQPESLLYLMLAANAKVKRAKIVPIHWIYAYYLKAYALIELRQNGEAQTLLERAAEMAPQNSQILSALGDAYQRNHDMDASLRTFQAAETAAREFASKETKDTELARAWRGQAYVYVERQQLDEAEALYRKCLALNAMDARARGELRYIEQQRAKLATQRPS